MMDDKTQERVREYYDDELENPFDKASHDLTEQELISLEDTMRYALWNLAKVLQDATEPQRQFVVDMINGWIKLIWKK